MGVALGIPKEDGVWDNLTFKSIYLNLLIKDILITSADAEKLVNILENRIEFEKGWKNWPILTT